MLEHNIIMGQQVFHYKRTMVSFQCKKMITTKNGGGYKCHIYGHGRLCERGF